MTDTTRVLIVDDHKIVRDGLQALLATEDGIEVVGTAANGGEAVTLDASLQPDVVLMDIEMPVMDGIEATRRISEARPESRVLILTSFATDDRVLPAIKAGARGYLLKDASPEQLTDAIRRVQRGESWLDPAVARTVLNELAQPQSKPPTEEPLTARELEVLQLLARGMSNQEIADELVISEATVRTHVSNVLAKLHVASRTQAALFALRHGIASLDDGEAP